MNKPPILFYSLHAYLEYDVIESWWVVRDECLLCNNPLKKKETCFIKFTYYDYTKQTRTEYTFEICWGCFDDKIINKSLEDLKLVIPLLKMKGTVEKLVYPNISISKLETPPIGDLSLKTSFYKKYISQEELINYFRRAEYYKTGRVLMKWH